ncbi:transcription initiation factor IIB [Haloparvum alkalitolerans]|uniref:transcription initiation factor IIB n=1 Tax=Haloparvum alkalitolerans TaxID=1042953 RepID=UPI003CF88EC5
MFRTIRADHPRSVPGLSKESAPSLSCMSGTRSTPSRSPGCPECDGQVRTDGTERVCGDCGLVVEADRIDHGPEWRSFADDDTSPERTGAPRTRARHDRGLSTEIGRSTRLTGRKKRRLARMRTHHKRSKIGSKRERNRVYSYTEIRRLVGELGLPESVRDQACALFDSAQDANLLRGRSLEGFSAAAVYAAARAANVARTRTEVREAAKATAGEQDAAFDAMNRELGLPVGPTDPAEYLPRFASELGCSTAVERRARELARRAVEEGTAGGRDPSGVAAACLYTAGQQVDAGGAVTQREAADVADVTPVTVRSTYVEIRGYRSRD